MAHLNDVCGPSLFVFLPIFSLFLSYDITLDKLGDDKGATKIEK